MASPLDSSDVENEASKISKAVKDNSPEKVEQAVSNVMTNNPEQSGAILKVAEAQLAKGKKDSQFDVKYGPDGKPSEITFIHDGWTRDTPHVVYNGSSGDTGRPEGMKAMGSAGQKYAEENDDVYGNK